MKEVIALSIIKDKRKERGLTRQQLSERIGEHPQVIVRWENGQEPSIVQAQKINQVLRIPYEHLANDYINKERD
jgi:transcriptional regulator with XRE-family HTH domain